MQDGREINEQKKSEKGGLITYGRLLSGYCFFLFPVNFKFIK